MSVTPAGTISKPLAALRSAVALSSAFQDWVGTTDDNDSMDRVHVITAPAEAPVPFAVVDMAEFKRQRVSINDAKPFVTMDPSASLLYFRDAVAAGMNDLDAAYTFCNNVGAVLSNLELFAGDRLNGFPAIIQIEMIAAPIRIAFEERPTAGDFYEATFAIYWSRQP